MKITFYVTQELYDAMRFASKEKGISEFIVSAIHDKLYPTTKEGVVSEVLPTEVDSLPEKKTRGTKKEKAVIDKEIKKL